MTRVKKFDLRSVLNRNRVRRYRLKKQIFKESIEENNIYYEFQKSLNDRFNDDRNISLRDRLRMWASNHRITSRAINDLLRILNISGKHFLKKIM